MSVGLLFPLTGGSRRHSHKYFPRKQTPGTSIKGGTDMVECVCSLAQSAKAISSYCLMSPSDTQTVLCELSEGVRGRVVCTDSVCRQRAGNKQHPWLWHQIRGPPVSWDSVMSLVFQRLRSAQTPAGQVGASHFPCI